MRTGLFHGSTDILTRLHKRVMLVLSVCIACCADNFISAFLARLIEKCTSHCAVLFVGYFTFFRANFLLHRSTFLKLIRKKHYVIKDDKFLHFYFLISSV